MAVARDDPYLAQNFTVEIDLTYLPPGKSIRISLDSAPLLFARRKENSFRARVQYRDRSGNEYSETFAHDLDVYRDLPEPGSPSIDSSP